MSRIRRATALAGTSLTLGVGLALAGAAGANAATETTVIHPDGSVETCFTDTVERQGQWIDIAGCMVTPPPPIAMA